MNNLNYQLIDTAGQITAVFDTAMTKSQQIKVAKKLIKQTPDMGQACFLKNKGDYYDCQMMGNELSVNGSLAGGFFLLKKYQLESLDFKISGSNDLSTIVLRSNGAEIFFPNLIKKVSKNESVVEFSGMKYQLVPNFVPQKLRNSYIQKLKQLAKNSPASGLIFYKGSSIQPLIYVKSTNTFVWETSCGSGSIAYSVISGITKIRQPSNKYVQIKIIDKDVIYSADCRMLL